jgi:hypothetical protein
MSRRSARGRWQRAVDVDDDNRLTVTQAFLRARRRFSARHLLNRLGCEPEGLSSSASERMLSMTLKPLRMAVSMTSVSSCPFARPLRAACVTGGRRC